MTDALEQARDRWVAELANPSSPHSLLFADKLRKQWVEYHEIQEGKRRPKRAPWYAWVIVLLATPFILVYDALIDGHRWGKR